MATNSTEARITLTASDQTKAAIASVQRNLTGLSDQAGGLVGKFGTIGTAIAAAFAGASLKGSIDVLDELGKMSEKSGIATESLSALRYAGEISNVSTEQLGSGMLKLSKSMAEAAGGGKAMQDVYKAIGVSVTDSNGKLRSTNDVLFDVADKFKSYEDGAGKAALAMQIFGKSGADMIPLLNQGSAGIRELTDEGKKLGAVYGGEIAQQAREFNDNLKRLELAAEGAKVGILEDLIPALVRFTNELIQGKMAFGGYLSAMYELGLRSSPFDSWSDGAKKAAQNVKDLEEAIKEAMTADMNTPEFAALPGLRRNLATAEKKKAYFDALIFNQTKAEADRLETAFNTGGGTGKVKAPVSDRTGGANATAGAAYVASINKEVGALIGPSDKLGEVWAHVLNNLDKLTMAQRVDVLTKAVWIDKQNEMTKAADNMAKQTTAEITAIEKATDAHYAAFEALEKSTLAQQIEVESLSKLQPAIDAAKFAREQSILVRHAEAALVQRGMAEGWDEVRMQEERTRVYKEAADALRNFNTVQADAADKTYNPNQGVAEAAKEYVEMARKGGEAAKEASTRVIGSMEDTLTSFFSTGKLNIKSLIDTIISEFMRLQVVRPLMAQIFGDGGAGSGFLSRIFGGGGGGGGSGIDFDVGSFPMLATGGPANAGMPYIVGERGPELFIPGASGTVIPNNRLAGGGGTVFAPVYNVNIDSRSDAASVYSGVRQMLAQHSRQQRDEFERMGLINT